MNSIQELQRDANLAIKEHGKGKVVSEIEDRMSSIEMEISALSYYDKEKIDSMLNRKAYFLELRNKIKELLGVN